MTQWITHFVDFLGSHGTLAVLFAFLVSFGEAMLIIGLFVPSTVVLVGLGTLIGLGKMAFLPVFAASVAGAIAGDALSFWAGVHWKDRIRTFWPFSRYGALIDKGEQFIARHGGKSIFIVRFIPGVKAVVPTIAGMMGMSSARFALVNVASAFVWAAAHLLPAIALGRGLQVAHSANPRFVLLAGLALGLTFLLWVAMRVTRGILIPLADQGRLRLALLLDRQGAGPSGVARVLRNDEGALEAAALIGLTVCGVAGFALLAFAVIFDPELALADAAIGQFVQGLRTEWATSAMLGITMLGDMAVLLPLALLLIAALALWRDWWMALAVAAAGLAGVVFVPLLKALLHRARPMEMYQGTDGFSFPSGHSTFATIILGMLALFVARSLPVRFRGAVYAVFAMLVALIALSRVYLQAHWPTDVLAGMLFGGAVVSVMALMLHARTVAVPKWAFAGLLAITGLVVVPIHLWTGWSSAKARYDASPALTTMAFADWQRSGWKTLPDRRILLDGDPGEPMLLQTTRPMVDVVTDLNAAGWQPSKTALLDQVLAAFLPTHQLLSQHAPWPLTHLGRPANRTLTKPGSPDERLVLRVWVSDMLVQDGRASAPLMLFSMTADRLDPLVFGFAQLEQTVMTESQLKTEQDGLVAALDKRAGPSGTTLAVPVTAAP